MCVIFFTSVPLELNFVIYTKNNKNGISALLNETTARMLYVFHTITAKHMHWNFSLRNFSGMRLKYKQTKKGNYVRRWDDALIQSSILNRSFNCKKIYLHNYVKYLKNQILLRGSSHTSRVQPFEISSVSYNEILNLNIQLYCSCFFSLFSF